MKFLVVVTPPSIYQHPSNPVFKYLQAILNMIINFMEYCISLDTKEWEDMKNSLVDFLSDILMSCTIKQNDQ